MNRSVRAIPSLIVALLLAIPAAARDATLSLSRESITTADRLTLEVAFVVAPGWTLEPWKASTRAALEGAGWTVVEVNGFAPSLWSELHGNDDGAVDGALVHRARFVLEPFLPGTYGIPAIEATATSAAGSAAEPIGEDNRAWRVSARPDPEGEGLIVRGNASVRDLEANESPRALAGFLTLARPRGQPVTLSTEPATIEVRSVLPEDEPVQLPMPIDEAASADAESEGDAPLGTLRPVPDEPASAFSLLALVVIGLAAVGTGIVVFIAFRAARTKGDESQPDPLRTLRSLASQPSPDLASVDRAVRALQRRQPGDPEIESLLGRLERARYAPRDADAEPAQAIASDAARLASRFAEAPAPAHDRTEQRESGQEAAA